MQILLSIVLLSFFVLGIILVIIAYKPIFKNTNKTNTKDELKIKDEVDKNLRILQRQEPPTQKAQAFISLMRLSYVLVHTIVNKGNKYNDEKQMKSFCDSLTPQIIDKLYSLEERDEYSTF